jgi:hypothetical protein
MKQQIEKIQSEIKELQTQLSDKWKRINDLYASCQHYWTEPAYRSRKVEFGVDAYGGSYDQGEWERTCHICGKLEITTRSNLISIPDFEAPNGKINISVFGGLAYPAK